MKMNLSQFKKVHEDSKSAILEHPSGHKIHVSKEALSSKLKKDLGGLHLHSGGEVKHLFNGGDPLEAPEVNSSSVPNSSSASDFISAPQMSIQPQGEVIPPSGPANSSVPMDQAQAKPQVTANYEIPRSAKRPLPNDVTGMKQFGQGVSEQKAGITGEAKALGQQGSEQAAASSQYIGDMNALSGASQKKTDALMNEYEAFKKDISNSHINPNHYMESMSTGSKIQTAIGLLLGGMGGGITHQGNPAADFLEKSIERDIAAQQSNLGKKENLMSANMKMFGNIRDATEMTRLQMNAVMAAKIQQAAEKTQDPLAKAKAQQAIGQINQTVGPTLGGMAMRQQALEGTQSGSIDPALAVRFIVPEHQQGEAFKELQTMQNMSKQKDNLMSAFEELGNKNTLSNRILSPIQTSKEVNAIREPLLAQLVKDSEGRITPQDTEMIKALFPAVGDSAQVLSTKRNRLGSFVSEKMHFPLLKSFGIEPPRQAPKANPNVPQNYKK